ncbi:hypothetical protein HQ447_12570 [bacterium]|nr:hypothetical protein [bacterium]
MPFACQNGRCDTPCWMRRVLRAAGIYHLLFAVWAFCWPHLWFDWNGIEQPNHPLMWQAVALVTGGFGLGLLLAAKNPIGHWMIVLIGLMKFTLAGAGLGIAIYQRGMPLSSIFILVANDLVWWFPFAAILWACLRAHAGVPPTRSEPLSIAEAAASYSLSNGKTLEEASQSQLLALVFLRHFGCTFTRQILRGLESIQKEAHAHGAELVLVHMLQGGKEIRYLGERSGVTRIADPRCELYRAFGLGKGGFLELFGPHVWWRGAVSIFKGCGLGHLAGDGLQMPGAFLFRDGEIVCSQRAHSASDLPDLPGLFQTLPLPATTDTLPA